ncbi:hypothetical protein [Rhodovibrio salinarum]|uniref:Uncharacterized protein n=1 Tax=Rhodovibrio salinarum TaxID=1087 RepID=A0A934QKB8_9PROT|nr:hypothetical protein [Rhodovibrio salinarum]MBK1698070.1 hypothetical protein [Rhodovibrio salinarum]
MLAASDILVFSVQIAVLLLVAAVFWRPVAAVVLLACGVCGLAFALLGQGSGWLVVGVFAVFCAWRSLQVSFVQVKYAGLDVFSVKAPEKAPSETELLDKLVARMTEFNAVRRQRAEAAKAAAEAETVQAEPETAPANTRTNSRRERTERVSSGQRLDRFARRQLAGKSSSTRAMPETDEVPALPHDPDDAQKRRLDSTKTSPKAVA